jgi:glycosyltransferase involved in cell wall biosynthesis
MTPPTDIVIAARLTREFPYEQHFAECIESLKAKTENFRLILVDDASDGQGQEFISNIAKTMRDCILIRTHFQHWFTRAYNLGLRMARTPYVVTLNSDTILRDGWLQEMYDVRDLAEKEHGKVGLVGSLLSYEEQRRWANSVMKDYVTGHAWLLNTAAIHEVSVGRGTPGLYLDELRPGTIHIHSDVELCWAMNGMGWATIKSFKSGVDHIGGKAWGHQLHRISQVTLQDVSYHYTVR